MEDKPARELFFNDGWVLSPRTTLVASQFRKYSGSDISRISVIVDGRWTYQDFDDAAVSVTGLNQDRQSFFLGHNGLVLTTGKGSKNIESLPNSSDYGYILRIRAIADQVYACGMTGQVYSRNSSGAWTHIDEGILGIEGLDLEDIDGTQHDDIYVVGMYGAIYHFDGFHWKRIDSPTNRPLSNVRCVSSKEVYICGDDGHLFRGSLNQWEDIGRKDIDYNFYGLDIFQGNVYVAHPSGIMVHDGDKLDPVELNLERPVSCHRLHSDDSVLWSFGIDDILSFDGSVWTEIVCPMNV